jgi:small-conductance mechanosensitive channel
MTFEGLSLEQLKQLLEGVSANPYVQALIVATVSAVAAIITDWFITHVLFRLTRRTRSNLDDQLISTLHRPLFTTVLLIGLWVAFLLLNPGSSVRWVGANVIKTVVVFMWVVFGIRAATIVLSQASADSKANRFIQPATRPLFETAAKLLLIAIGVYLIMISWGVDPVGWLATAGIAAIAVGLAAQDTLGNLFAGLSIMVDAPYKIGDYIILEGVDRGRVTKIGLRSTRLLTRDDLEVIVPNSVIAASKIINECQGRWVKQRLRIPVGVAYGSDVDLVKSILSDIASAQQGVARNPLPWVKFCGFGESSLDFEIRCWIDDPEVRGRVTDRVNTEVYKALKEQGIEIPFPKRDLYIKEMPLVPSQQPEDVDSE